MFLLRKTIDELPKKLKESIEVFGKETTEFILKELKKENPENVLTKRVGSIDDLSKENLEEIKKQNWLHESILAQSGIRTKYNPDKDKFKLILEGINEFVKTWDQQTINELQKEIDQSLNKFEYPEGYTFVKNVKEGIRNGCRISGRLLYPKDEGFIGWHTNANDPGLRIYLNWTDNPNNEGGLLYEKDNQIVLDPDNEPFLLRAFVGGPNQFHAVKAGKGNRLSLGFRFLRKGENKEI